MSEIGVTHAGRKHQSIERNDGSILQQDVAAWHINTADHPSNVVTSWRLRTRKRIGQAISEVANAAVATW